MRKTAWVALIVVMWSAATACAAGPKYRISPRVDREQGIYRCGETATFTLCVSKDGKPAEDGEVTLRVGTWTGTSVLEETRKIEGKPVQIEMTRDKPGFLIGRVVYRTPEGKDIKAPFGVGLGFDPEKLEPAVVMPEDFDAFWEAARKERDAIPMDLKLTKCEEASSPDVDVFKVSVANVDNTRAYGYLSVPKKHKPPFAVSIGVPGAGPGPKGPSASWTARRGALSLQATVHPYDIRPFDGEPVDIKKVYRGSYSRSGAPDKKKYFFYRAILGIDRLIGYVASRPDADRTRFSIWGVSQGGGLALILGGLNNDKFTSIWSNVAGMCDHSAYRLGRETSWPGLIPGDVRKDPAREPAYREFSAYFDAVNFARRIKCPTLIGAGLADDCCKGANIYSAYNVIQAPKRIATGPNTFHPGTPPAMKKLDDDEWKAIVKKAGEKIE
jgi:cephalosporin-C deacetylase-like acetyl esterase